MWALLHPLEKKNKSNFYQWTNQTCHSWNVVPSNTEGVKQHSSWELAILLFFSLQKMRLKGKKKNYCSFLQNWELFSIFKSLCMFQKVSHSLLYCGLAPFFLVLMLPFAETKKSLHTMSLNGIVFYMYKICKQKMRREWENNKKKIFCLSSPSVFARNV